DSDRSRTIDNQRIVAGESPRRLPARRARGNRSARWPGVSKRPDHFRSLALVFDLLAGLLNLRPDRLRRLARLVGDLVGRLLGLPCPRVDGFFAFALGVGHKSPPVIALDKDGFEESGTKRTRIVDDRARVPGPRRTDRPRSPTTACRTGLSPHQPTTHE